MDLSSKTRRERLHWPLPAAAVLVLAAAPAFADDGDRERKNTENTPVTITSTNPCFGPADPVTKQHTGEPIEGPGTQQRTTKEKIKRDGTMETRTRTITSGRPVGDVSLVTYDYDNDNTVNLRFKPNGATKFISRTREEGIPERSRSATGQPVPRFVVTIVDETVFDPANPAKNKTKFERDEKCRDKQGRDRCNDADGHRDHDGSYD
jgi:hypothetical protein